MLSKNLSQKKKHYQRDNTLLSFVLYFVKYNKLNHKKGQLIMVDIKNAYTALLERLETENVIEVKQELCEHAQKLGLEDTLVIDELRADDSLTLEEIIDILEVETEDNPILRRLLLVLKANLRKRKLKANPAANDKAIDKELASLAFVE